MAARAVSIGDYELTVLKRIYRDGGGSVLLGEEEVRFGRAKIEGGEAERMHVAIEKLAAAEYLEYAGDGAYEISEQGEDYLDTVGF